MLCNNFEITYNLNIRRTITIDVRNNLLDLTYSSLICRNISQSSLFESLKVSRAKLGKIQEGLQR